MNDIQRRLKAKKIIFDYFNKKLLHSTKHKIASKKLAKCDLFTMFEECKECTGYCVDDGEGIEEGSGTCVHPKYFTEINNE